MKNYFSKISNVELRNTSLFFERPTGIEKLPLYSKGVFSTRFVRSSTRRANSNSSHVLMGFTLLETLVAAAILLAVVVGPIALINRALFSGSFSRNSLIAHNLAQEGIELFREVRDNNVLCAGLGGSVSWNDDPGGPPPKLLGYYEIDPLFSPESVTALTCGSSFINTPKPIKRTQFTCNTPILTSDDGEYTYTSGTPTNFTRCVKVCSPPNAAPCGSGADGDIPADDQMDIISTVSWTERGFPRSVTLRDRLYAWK